MSAPDEPRPISASEAMARLTGDPSPWGTPSSSPQPGACVFVPLEGEDDTCWSCGRSEAAHATRPTSTPSSGERPPAHTCGAINTPCEHPLCAPAPSSPVAESGQPDTEALVWFHDPASNTEVRLTVREAAAVILALQDQVRKDPAWDDVRDEDPTPIDTWLHLALDAEGYYEHVEACVLPRPGDPHPFTPDAGGDCTVCFDTFENGPHAAQPARPVSPVDARGWVADEHGETLMHWSGATMDWMAVGSVAAFNDLVTLVAAADRSTPPPTPPREQGEDR